jgi:hypothetical protein
MTIVEKYIQGLKKAYYDNGLNNLWEDFETYKRGASKEDIAKLKEIHPDTPHSLICLLEYANGTYIIKKKGDNEDDDFEVPILSSEWALCNHYLFSTDEMISWGKANPASDFLKIAIEENWDADPQITREAESASWLWFAVGRSGDNERLYIDFTPSETGTKGQVVAYISDPDDLTVVADSFDIYLEKLMEREYDFVEEIEED